ncbi:MAG: DsbA family protein [Flavobacteriales bacterium]
MKRLVFPFLLLFTTINISAMDKDSSNNKPEILYIFDPLCGWCYGFGPVVSQIEKAYSEKANFTIISGGMVRADRAEPIGKMADYILSAIPRLEQLTGVKMGEAYIKLLKEGNSVFSSEKPSQALEAYRKIKNENIIDFAHSMQKKLFYEGKSLEVDSTYIELATEYGIDPVQFISTLNEIATRSAMLDGFKFVSQLGVSGFPAVIGKKNEQYYLLANGYTSVEQISKTLDAFLK